MRFRSSNVRGYTHHLGDLAAQVDSSHGVLLSGGSTGGVVESIGDDANVSLSIRGKGTGGVTIGNSSSPVQIGASSTPFALIQRYTIQIDSGALVLPALGAGDTVSTQAGVTTNAVLVFTPRATISTAYGFQVMCSTANEVRLRIFNHDNATMGSGESSNRGTLLAFTF